MTFVVLGKAKNVSYLWEEIYTMGVRDLNLGTRKKRLSQSTHSTRSSTLVLFESLGACRGPR